MTTTDRPAAAASAVRTATRRLIPLMALCYFFAYLDRTNLAVASLTMNDDIGIDSFQYGLGAGLLFVGYILLDAPSNLVLHRVGARRWMARIMVIWGVVAAACAAISGPTSFYVLRFLLGMAEAGFFPGMILYLTYWFPQARRGQVTGLFMIAVPLSTAIGAPLGGQLLRLDGALGLAGWQWLFVLEGLPAAVLGILLLWLLPDKPRDASWLTAEQKSALGATIAAEQAGTERRSPLTVLQAARHRRVLGLSLVYFAIAFGLYGLGFWMPQIIKKNLAVDDTTTITLLTAAPYVVGAIAMVLSGRYCDRVRRPVPCTAWPLGLGGAALGVTAFLTGTPWVGYAGLCACAIGVMAAFPCFWTMPAAFVAGAAGAVGIGVINSIGNISGFLGPYWVGWMTSLFGSSKWGLVTIAIVMVAGAGLVVALGDPHRRPSTVPAAGPADAAGVQHA